jgi:hypothetical protein
MEKGVSMFMQQIQVPFFTKTHHDPSTTYFGMFVHMYMYLLNIFIFSTSIEISIWMKVVWIYKILKSIPLYHVECSHKKTLV